jgi:hypothetical protein
LPLAREEEEDDEEEDEEGAAASWPPVMSTIVLAWPPQASIRLTARACF